MSNPRVDFVETSKIPGRDRYAVAWQSRRGRIVRTFPYKPWAESAALAHPGAKILAYPNTNLPPTFEEIQTQGYTPLVSNFLLDLNLN